MWGYINTWVEQPTHEPRPSGASEDDEGVTNKIHLAGWHEAKPAQQKISPHQRRAAARAGIANASCGYERGKRTK